MTREELRYKYEKEICELCCREYYTSRALPESLCEGQFCEEAEDSFAEEQAKLNGVKKIGLEFDKDESDRFVLDWYLRSGYKLFDKKSNLLIKKLEE